MTKSKAQIELETLKLQLREAMDARKKAEELASAATQELQKYQKPERDPLMTCPGKFAYIYGALGYRPESVADLAIMTVAVHIHHKLRVKGEISLSGIRTTGTGAYPVGCLLAPVEQTEEQKEEIEALKIICNTLRQTKEFRTRNASWTASRIASLFPDHYPDFVDTKEQTPDLI